MDQADWPPLGKSPDRPATTASSRTNTPGSSHHHKKAKGSDQRGPNTIDRFLDPKTSSTKGQSSTSKGTTSPDTTTTDTSPMESDTPGSSSLLDDLSQPSASSQSLPPPPPPLFPSFGLPTGPPTDRQFPAFTGYGNPKKSTRVPTTTRPSKQPTSTPNLVRENPPVPRLLHLPRVSYLDSWYSLFIHT